MLEVVREWLGREGKNLPLNFALVFKDRLYQNYRVFQGLTEGRLIAPVVKANAYGHGAETVVEIFRSYGVEFPFACVTSLQEAQDLHKRFKDLDVLIMGGVNPYTVPSDLNPHTIFSVWDAQTLKILAARLSQVRVHIKLDTGMHRLGIRTKGLVGLLRLIKRLRNVKVEGVFSHLPMPENRWYTDIQIREFKKAYRILRKLGFKPRYRHISATYGALVVKDKLFNLIRLGIGLYGYVPARDDITEPFYLKLEPALALYSTLVRVGTLNEGESVGYGGTFTADEPKRIGTIPLGYNEWVDRRLSNCGMFRDLNGNNLPILGTVSMNMTTLDITKTNLKLLDHIEVFSADKDVVNSLYKFAELLDTIPYELLVRLDSSVARVVI